MTMTANLSEAVPQSLERPRLRGWSHLLAALVASVIGPIAIATSPGHRTSVTIFAVAVIALFATSGSYHRIFWGTKIQGIFRRLDHAMIFLMIAATYTPIALNSLEPLEARLLLGIVWSGAVCGVALQIFWPSAPRCWNVTSYLVVGWSILPFIPKVWQQLGANGFGLMLAGGVLYTTGAIIYAVQKPNPWPQWFGFHEIFHLLVIAALSSHYAAVTFVAIR